jgi:hypothetical protein
LDIWQSSRGECGSRSWTGPLSTRAAMRKNRV